MGIVVLCFPSMYLLVFCLRVWAMALGETTTEETQVDLRNSSDWNSTLDDMGGITKENCYLQKMDNGTLLIVNQTRAEVGEDAYKDYEEICEVNITRKLSASTLASLAGK